MESSEIIYTTNAVWVGAIYDALVEAGINADTLFQKHDIPLDIRQNPELRVDVRKMRNLWAEVTATTGNDAISLSVTNHVKNTASLLAILGGACENLQEAAEKMAKYMSAATTGITIKVSTTDTLNLEIQTTPTGFYVGEEAVDALTARIAALVPKATIPPITPLRIELKRKKPKCYTEFENFFECPLLFEQDQNAFIFAKEDAKVPFHTRNLTLALHMEEYLANYIEQQLPKNTSNQLIKNVFRHLSYMIPDGKPTITAIANRMNMSERTLQRKLKECDVSFQELLNKLRLDLSSHYLKQGDHSIEAISDLLGFSSYTSFIRFFKGETGKTPKEYIKAP